MELIKRIPKMKVLFFIEKRERRVQIYHLFQRAGFEKIDDFQNNKENALDYNYFFIEYSYECHDVIYEIVNNAREKAKFGTRPIFIFDMKNSDSIIDSVNSKELLPDFVINKPVNFSHIDNMVKKSFNLILLIEKIALESEGSHLKFIMKAKVSNSNYKNIMLLNMTLEELYKAREFNTFNKVFLKHDKSNITAQNLMNFCKVADSLKSFEVLEYLLRSQKYQFQANLMLSKFHAKNKNVNKEKQSLSRAFDLNPKDNNVFNQYIKFILCNDESELLYNMIMKRFYYIGISIDNIYQMIFNISDIILVNNIKISKDKYRILFSKVIITLNKRIPMSKRDELQGYISIFIAQYLYRYGKRYKAKEIAINNYNKHILNGNGNGNGNFDIFKLMVFNTLAMSGEVKICSSLYKTLDLSGNYDELFKKSISHFKRSSDVYQWIKRQDLISEETNSKFVKISKMYPYSYDINYALLLLILKNKNIADNKKLVKYSLRIINRLEKSNRVDSSMSSILKNKEILNNILVIK